MELVGVDWLDVYLRFFVCCVFVFYVFNAYKNSKYYSFIVVFESSSCVTVNYTQKKKPDVLV